MKLVPPNLDSKVADNGLYRAIYDTDENAAGTYDFSLKYSSGDKDIEITDNGTPYKVNVKAND